MNKEIEQLNEQAGKYSGILDKLKNEMQKIIVGQDEIIEKGLWFARKHNEKIWHLLRTDMLFL